MANVTFHVGSTAPPSTGLTTGGLYVDNTNGGIWYATSNDSRTEVGSWVKYTKTVTSTSGTKLGTITINGVSTDIHQDDSKGCSFNTSKKIYLIGTETQSATTDTGLQTYSHDTAYVGTDGCLYSNKSKCITVATETKNTAGGTDSIETLYLVGMKSHGETSAQTYSQGTCYTQGGHLYSNNKKCCGYSSKIVYGDQEAPNTKGETRTSTVTVSGEDLGGILVGYDYSGCSIDSMYKHDLCGVTVGVTTTGRGPSYKIGAKLTRTGPTFTEIRENFPKFTVYYIPFE